MSLTDSQIIFQDFLYPATGSSTVTLDAYIMPSNHMDAIGRDVNGMDYLKDVAPAAFVQTVEIHFHRMQLTRNDLDLFWNWMITGTHLYLIHLSLTKPIVYYEGMISNIDPLSIHDKLQGTGPYVITFKPDLASGSAPPFSY